MASTRCAISSCARCRSGRTAATATRRSSTASTPISPTISAIWRSARCRWWRKPSAECCRSRASSRPEDKAILAAADGMMAAAREHMKTQQLHQVLNAVWSVVADANRYFASEAPWAQGQDRSAAAGHDPVCDGGGDPPGRDPGAAGDAGLVRLSCSICWPCRRASAASRRWKAASASRPARNCRRRTACSRAMSSRKRNRRSPKGKAGRAARRKGLTMLVDSHCHLDFPDFAAELDAVVERARAAGIGRMVTISTRVKKFPQVLAVAEKFPDIFCSVGTHPHNAHEELDIDAAATGGADASIRKSSRSARPGSTITTTRARATRRSRAFASTSPRRARPACRWSFIRARPTPTWPHSDRRNGKGAFPAVLHCYTGGRELAFKAMELGPLYRLHRHPDFQERPGPARHRQGSAGRPHSGRNGFALSGAAALSRQTQRAVLRGEDRQDAGADARRVRGRDRAPDHREFLPAVHQGAAPAMIPKREPVSERSCATKTDAA